MDKHDTLISLVVNATNEETHLIVGLINLLKDHTFDGKEEALRQLKYVVDWLERELDSDEYDSAIQAMAKEGK